MHSSDRFPQQAHVLFHYHHHYRDHSQSVFQVVAEPDPSIRRRDLATNQCELSMIVEGKKGHISHLQEIRLADQAMGALRRATEHTHESRSFHSVFSSLQQSSV